MSFVEEMNGAEVLGKEYLSFAGAFQSAGRQAMRPKVGKSNR